MRVMYRYKWEDCEGVSVSEVSDIDITDEKKVMLTIASDEISDFITENPVDKDTYERALRDLLKNGYVDLSGQITGYDFGFFIPDEDEDEEEDSSESSDDESENENEDEGEEEKKTEEPSGFFSNFLHRKEG